MLRGTELPGGSMRRVFGWWWRVRLVLVALFVAVGGCSGHPGAGTPDGGGQPDAAAVGDSADAGAADATGDAGAGGDLGPVDVSAADAPTADVPPADVPLADVTSGDVPLADVPLADVTSGDVPLADVPAADVPLADVSGADAAPGDGWSDTTAGDAGTLGDAMGDVGTVDVAVADATLDEVAPGDASTDATAGDAGPQEDALLDVGAVDDVVADAALDDATTTPDAVADAALDDATETADALTDATLDDAVAEVTDDVAAEVTGDVIEEVTEPPTGPAPLLITELMARNGGDGAVLDEDGDSSDWVELHNPTDEVVLLEGWHLSDDPDVLDKWTLPAVELAPGGYLVVFASGKDRAVAGEELHTNFKLSGDGEYLALVAPTLEVVHAFDAFPPQLQGLSWGVLATVQDTPLVAAGDGARFAVGSVDAGWEAPGFDDSTWTEGPTGLGFFGGDELAPLDLVADSKAGFSGVQGQAGWWYGYWNRTADLDDVYEADELTLFPSDGGGFSPTDFWTGAGWDWFQGNPPWTWIGPEGSHPNGTNNGAEHWAVRRLVSPVAGTLLAQWHVRKTNPNGSGVSARLFREGVELDAVALAGWDTTGTVRTVLLEGLEVGERVDLTLEPTWIDGETHDGSDGSATWLKLWTVADYGPWIGTDVGAEMLGQTEEAAARLRFDLPAESGFNRLVLGMRYDDGFEAWLNGAPLAASAGA